MKIMEARSHKIKMFGLIRTSNIREISMTTVTDKKKIHLGGWLLSGRLIRKPRRYVDPLEEFHV
jgi:hypothetical protein